MKCCTPPLLLSSSTPAAFDSAMAPKKDKAPPSSFLGPTKMSRAMLKEMEGRGMIVPGTRRFRPRRRFMRSLKVTNVGIS